MVLFFFLLTESLIHYVDFGNLIKVDSINEDSVARILLSTSQEIASLVFVTSVIAISRRRI